MTYYYKNMDISKLLSGTGGITPGYENFPDHGIPTSSIELPLNLSYLYKGTDVSNYSTAFTIAFGAGTSQVILPNNANPGVSFTPLKI
jgi:hypothetical protein